MLVLVPCVLFSAYYPVLSCPFLSGTATPSNMGGLLIPPWYRNEDLSPLFSALVAFLFGFSTACAAFTAVTISSQAHRTWKRSRKVIKHPYIAMIVTEWVSSVVISVVSYLFILDIIPPRFVHSAPPRLSALPLDYSILMSSEPVADPLPHSFWLFFGIRMSSSQSR